MCAFGTSWDIRYIKETSMETGMNVGVYLIRKRLLENKIDLLLTIKFKTTSCLNIKYC